MVLPWGLRVCSYPRSHVRFHLPAKLLDQLGVMPGHYLHGPGISRGVHKPQASLDIRKVVLPWDSEVCSHLRSQIRLPLPTKLLEPLELCPVITSRTPELVEVRASSPGHPVYQKKKNTPALTIQSSSSKDDLTGKIPKANPAGRSKSPNLQPKHSNAPTPRPSPPP